MIVEATGTVVQGVLQLDGAVPLPDQTRVKLRIEPMWDAAEARKKWQALLARIDEHPIVGLSGSYSREELYERD